MSSVIRLLYCYPVLFAFFLSYLECCLCVRTGKNGAGGFLSFFLPPSLKGNCSRYFPVNVFAVHRGLKSHIISLLAIR